MNHIPATNGDPGKVSPAVPCSAESAKGGGPPGCRQPCPENPGERSTPFLRAFGTKKTCVLGNAHCFWIRSSWEGPPESNPETRKKQLNGAGWAPLLKLSKVNVFLVFSSPLFPGSIPLWSVWWWGQVLSSSPGTAGIFSEAPPKQRTPLKVCFRQLERPTHLDWAKAEEPKQRKPNHNATSTAPPTCNTANVTGNATCDVFSKQEETDF